MEPSDPRGRAGSSLTRHLARCSAPRGRASPLLFSGGEVRRAAPVRGGAEEHTASLPTDAEALTPAHLRALGLLQERGSITTAELAEHDHRSRESARRLLHTLEQRRLTSAELIGGGCLRYTLADV